MALRERGTPVDEMTIAEMRAGMASGELTAAGLTQAYLERIEALNRQGPAINAVIEVNPDAMGTARALDAERRAGHVRSPLHGVPVLIKDNIDTHDRMQTTSGSLALEGSIAPRDAFLVRRLRMAGAILLGKTNLSEWANFRGKHSISGWSSRGGLTRNPYALNRSASGSSSGSAAAVAANLCAAALGTETDGSITAPAQANGIVGLKPTLGLLSRAGIIPIAHSQDTAGPMARTVADAAALLGALTGVDERDAATRPSRQHRQRDYTAFLDPDGLRGARIGVARAMAGTDARVLKLLEDWLVQMRQLGAVIVDPVAVPDEGRYAKSELEVLLYEFKADLNTYLASRGPSVPRRSMSDIVKFNQEHEKRVMPYFGQEHMTAALEKGSLRSEAYRQALARNRRLTRVQGIDAAFRKHRLDAIVVPTGGPAGLIDMVNGDCDNSDIQSTSAPAVAGYPHITVPAGSILGLPVGLSFWGRAWQEPALLRLAYAFEQATKARKPPQFLAEVETAVLA